MIPYLAIGYVLSAAVWTVTFFLAYAYCIATSGFLIGVGFGWLPAGILATALATATIPSWGLVATLVLLALLF